MRPLIGITSDTEESERPANRKHEKQWIKTDLANAVIKAGGIPFIIPCIGTKREIKEALKRVDGILISGGNFDINPAYYGEKRSSFTSILKSGRTDFEFLLLEQAVRLKLPILGICGGEQLINVYFGGTLYQDILAERPKSINHEQKKHTSKSDHLVTIKEKTVLSKITGAKSMRVNSTHHQAVKEVGNGLVVSAVAKDGVIEAIEKQGESYIIGVQWHPEFLVRFPSQIRIFKSFVTASKKKVI